MTTGLIPDFINNQLRGLKGFGHDVGNVAGAAAHNVLQPALQAGGKDLSAVNRDVMQPANTVLFGSPQTPDNSAGPHGPMSQPAPATPTSPSDNLSYQAAVATAVAPLMAQIAKEGNTGQINAALSKGPSASSANSAIPGLAAQIASTLHSQSQDYQDGLNTMLKYVGTAQTQSDLVKGLGGLISYPIALPGQQNVPQSVQEDPLLQTLYNTLNQMRNYGGASTSTGSNMTGYNSSIANLVNQ